MSPRPEVFTDDVQPHQPTTYQSWVLEACATDRSQVTYLATACLSAAHFARTSLCTCLRLCFTDTSGVHSVSDTLKEGTVYYGKALRQLHSNLRDPEYWKSDANVAATILLSAYEVLTYFKTLRVPTDNYSLQLLRIVWVGCSMQVVLGSLLRPEVPKSPKLNRQEGKSTKECISGY